MKRAAVVFLLIFLMVISCGEESLRQTVPFAPANFRVDPGGFDSELANPLSCKIFTEKERRLPTDRFGYAGLLVVSDANGRLHAFDLCCPHEDSRQITVAADYEGNGYNGQVKCNACGSVFETMFGHGNVVSGPATERLQQYPVTMLNDGSYRLLN